jgi:DNA-binding NtrC family response regulator
MDAQHHKETLLFVDDEENILDIASEYFEFKGFQVLTARNGREAVRVLETERVDCCFTDINMPEMDGLALAEHIHHTDNTIPVIVMTGYPSLDNTIATLKNGVVDFLIKPVNLADGAGGAPGAAPTAIVRGEHSAAKRSRAETTPGKAEPRTCLQSGRAQSGQPHHE